MMQLSTLFASIVSISLVSAHYVFPNITIDGVTSGNWVNIRQTNNWQALTPLTDVTSSDMQCYDSTESGTASTATIAAGSPLTVNVWGNPASMYHPSVVNVYMAKAPSTVAGWTPTDAAWFKVYEITAVTDGGTAITFPAQNLPSFAFTIPSEVPSGQYLVRVENIALHVAQSFGGAQFYISCIQLEVTGGGTGTPGPLVAFPGAYTGYEPGILIDIWYPVPANYTQPGPAVWPASSA